jgi:hypothetical protein
MTQYSSTTAIDLHSLESSTKVDLVVIPNARGTFRSLCLIGFSKKHENTVDWQRTTQSTYPHSRRLFPS